MAPLGLRAHSRCNWAQLRSCLEEVRASMGADPPPEECRLGSCDPSDHLSYNSVASHLMCTPIAHSDKVWEVMEGWDRVVPGGSHAHREHIPLFLV